MENIILENITHLQEMEKNAFQIGEGKGYDKGFNDGFEMGKELHKDNCYKLKEEKQLVLKLENLCGKPHNGGCGEEECFECQIIKRNL